VQNRLYLPNVTHFLLKQLSFVEEVLKILHFKGDMFYGLLYDQFYHNTAKHCFVLINWSPCSITIFLIEKVLSATYLERKKTKLYFVFLLSDVGLKSDFDFDESHCF